MSVERQMPEHCVKAYNRAMSGKSRNAAIKAFCRECVGYENMALEIRLCTDRSCPLYPYRPHRKAKSI